MQQVAATLTGITLGIFILHLLMRRREAARREAGPLLFRDLWGSQRGGTILIMICVGICIVDVLRRGDVFGEKPFGLFYIALVCTFMISGLLAAKSVVGRFPWRWIELCEKGVISGSNRGDMLFTPWHRMRYCQWLDSRGTLSIWGLEPFKVAPGKIQAVNEALLARTELRDPSGEVLNPDFVRPEAPPERPESIRRPFQYEIKTLLLLMLFASAAFAWVSTVLHGQ